MRQMTAKCLMVAWSTSVAPLARQSDAAIIVPKYLFSKDLERPIVLIESKAQQDEGLELPSYGLEGLPTASRDEKRAIIRTRPLPLSVEPLDEKKDEARP